MTFKLVRVNWRSVSTANISRGEGGQNEDTGVVPNLLKTCMPTRSALSVCIVGERLSATAHTDALAFCTLHCTAMVVAVEWFIVHEHICSVRGRNTEHDDTRTIENTLCLGDLAQPADSAVKEISPWYLNTGAVTYLRTVAAAVVDTVQAPPAITFLHDPHFQIPTA